MNDTPGIRCSEALRQQLAELLSEGQNVKAIRKLRRETGCTLAQALEFVDALCNELSLDRPPAIAESTIDWCSPRIVVPLAGLFGLVFGPFFPQKRGGEPLHPILCAGVAMLVAAIAYWKYRD